MTPTEQPRARNLKTRLLAFCISLLVRALSATLRLTLEGEEEAERFMRDHGGAIFVTWHGRTLVPINRFRNRGYYALISLSRDGELQAENFRCMGFKVIRGSTGRRGVAATREVIAALNAGGVLAFTPDGPRGPSHKVQPGVVYFARRSGKPIVPVGIGANPCWNLRSWDNFLIPRPFSRARWVYGEPIFVREDEDLEAASQHLESVLNDLEARAEHHVGRLAKAPLKV